MDGGLVHAQQGQQGHENIQMLHGHMSQLLGSQIRPGFWQPVNAQQNPGSTVYQIKGPGSNPGPGAGLVRKDDSDSGPRRPEAAPAPAGGIDLSGTQAEEAAAQQWAQASQVSSI